MVAESKSWTVAEAKAHLSELIDRAVNEGPQTITRRGREMVVVVSAEEWASAAGRSRESAKSEQKGTLVEFFEKSPLRGSGLVIPERELDWPNEIEL